MTTTDYSQVDAYAGANAKPKRHGFAAILKGWVAARRVRRAERQALTDLSHLDAHLLRDIGLNPGDVQAALRGGHSSVWLNPLRSRAEHE
jgi:uncharacterized protein YjiS (DUF1127 family)